MFLALFLFFLAILGLMFLKEEIFEKKFKGFEALSRNVRLTDLLHSKMSFFRKVFARKLVSSLSAYINHNYHFVAALFLLYSRDLIRKEVDLLFFYYYLF